MDEALPEPGTGAVAGPMSWPLGPHYFDLTGSEGATAWIRYRVWAADWHVRTLRALADEAQTYDRLVGIEMALDGALNGLSSAFDAALALLIPVAEDRLGLAPDERTPTFRYSWKQARRLLTEGAIGTDPEGTATDVVWRVILDIDNALEGETDEVPSGWLAMLRRLRNRVAHQDTLARHHQSGGSSTVRAFGSRVTAFEYLARACDQLHDLTEQMVALARYLGSTEVATVPSRRSWFPPVREDRW